MRYHQPKKGNSVTTSRELAAFNPAANSVFQVAIAIQRQSQLAGPGEEFSPHGRDVVLVAFTIVGPRLTRRANRISVQLLVDGMQTWITLRSLHRWQGRQKAGHFSYKWPGFCRRARPPLREGRDSMQAMFSSKPYAADGVRKVAVGRYQPAVKVRQAANGASR